MTFDEAVKKLKLLGEQGADTWWGPQLEEHTHVKGHLEQGDIELLIYQLRKTYAPEIEMTQSQKNSFDEAKRALHTHDLSLNFGQEWTVLDEVSGNIFGHGPGEATDEQINMIMRAWLHPELVKVVD